MLTVQYPQRRVWGDSEVAGADETAGLSLTGGADIGWDEHDTKISSARTAITTFNEFLMLCTPDTGLGYLIVPSHPGHDNPCPGCLSRACYFMLIATRLRRVRIIPITPTSLIRSLNAITATIATTMTDAAEVVGKTR